MEIDHDTERPTTFSGGWWIATMALRVTAINLLVISLAICVINVLKLPYGVNKVEIIHLYDDSGLKLIYFIVVLVIGYLVLQIVLAVRLKKANRDPNLLCLFYGEWFSCVALFLCGIGGISSTKGYKKIWHRDWFQEDDAASQYDYYFCISYAASAMLLFASFCNFTSSILIWCVCPGRFNRFSGLVSKKNSAKVQPAAMDN